MRQPAPDQRGETKVRHGFSRASLQTPCKSAARMRMHLLATTMLLFGGAAFAQTPANPSQGQLAAPFGSGPAANNNNNSWGIANTPSGSKAAGSTSSIYPPNVIKVPEPGTVVIRLNGRVEVDLGANFSSADQGLTAAGAPNGYKLNPLGIGTNMRLYPGFDGMSANGIRYGAAVELRQNFYGGNNFQPNYTTTIAGGTATTTQNASSAAGPSGVTSAQTVFVRRAFTYLATDQAGLLRVGQADGVLGLFDNCVFTSECWDAGVMGLQTGGYNALAPNNMIIPFVWLNQSGAEYGNNKVVYLSPQFYGFDFGVQYAPSQGNAFSDASGSSPLQTTPCGQASANCVGVTSGNDATRWYNQVGVGLRWQQAFGPVDVKAYGFYETAGKENLTTAAYAPVSRTGSASSFHYDNLSFYKAGAAVSMSGFTVAADYIGGAVNGALQMRPRGGAPMNAVLTGITWAGGPLTLGAEIGIINSQGDARLTGVSQRREEEVSFGGNYKVAPGLQLVGEFTYAQRHQGGFDFNQNAPGTTRDARNTNYLLATVLTW